MSKFKVGDVCVVTRPLIHPEMLGSECTITGVCLLGYDTDFSGQYYFAFPWQLRLRRPPSWDSWLYDTRDVEREQRTQAPTQEPTHAQP